jgi:apolipoprotein N-acyltransferase
MAPASGTAVSSARSLGRLPAAGLSSLAGVMLALAFPRVGLWPLAWLSFVPFLFALKGRRARHGLLWGWLTGTVATAIGMSWIAGLLERFAGVAWPLAVLATVISAAAHGAALALCGMLTCWLWSHGVRPIIALPLSLVTAELLVPMVFPWPVGMSQYQVLAVIQISDVLGVHGISFLVALGGAAIYELVTDPADARTRCWVLGAGAIVAACLVYGAVRIGQVRAARERAPSITVGLVQAGLSIADKHDPRRFSINAALHRDMSAQLEREGAELVIWPESSHPYTFDHDATRDHRGPRAVRQGFTIPVIFGVGTVDDDRHRRYNSAFLLDAEGTLHGPADKNQLLLFGEVIPFYDDIAWLREMFPNAWNFTPGTEPGVLEDGRLRAGVLNCYEDMLPDLVRQLARRRPNLLVNVTNDAWFGDTAEPYEHLAGSVLRAVEHRVDLVRAVNSGVTAVVSSTGQVMAQTRVGGPMARFGGDEFERTTVLARVRLHDAGTVYTKLGDSWVWAIAIAVFLSIRGVYRRRGAQP